MVTAHVVVGSSVVNLDPLGAQIIGAVRLYTSKIDCIGDLTKGAVSYLHYFGSHLGSMVKYGVLGAFYLFFFTEFTVILVAMATGWVKRCTAHPEIQKQFYNSIIIGGLLVLHC